MAALVRGTATITRRDDDMVIQAEIWDPRAPQGVRDMVLRIPFMEWVDAITRGLPGRGMRA